jgi:hypothetical protein
MRELLVKEVVIAAGSIAKLGIKSDIGTWAWSCAEESCGIRYKGLSVSPGHEDRLESRR